MPGIGLPFNGTLTAFIEMPGGILADGGTGLAESPAGIFTGSIFISRPVMESALEAEFAGPFEPQPKLVMTIAKLSKMNVVLNIINGL